MSLFKLTPILNGFSKMTTEDFKRPDHPDFMTSAELKKIEFSGRRNNSISWQHELWITGEIVRTVSYEEAQKNPLAAVEAFADFFGVR